MGKFFGGLALGLLFGAGALYGYLQFAAAEAPSPCDARCGDGTVCEGDICIPSPAQVEPEPEDGKRSKKRRRRGRRGKDRRGPDSSATGTLAHLDDKVPRFDPKATKTLDMNAGSERLSDRVVNRELRELDRAFEDCVRKAAGLTDELGTGKVSLSFGVKGSGRVSGVNARAPTNLKAVGVDACARKAVYEHRFPGFDGPDMSVTASFDVE